MSSSILDRIEADAESFSDVTKEKGSELSQLIAAAQYQQEQITFHETQAKEAKQEKLRILREQIPLFLLRSFIFCPNFCLYVIPEKIVVIVSTPWHQPQGAPATLPVAAFLAPRPLVRFASETVEKRSRWRLGRHAASNNGRQDCAPGPHASIGTKLLDARHPGLRKPHRRALLQITYFASAHCPD